MGDEARIFDLWDIEAKTVRCVCCMNDGGRWTFGTAGTPNPIERQFPNDARPKANRFTETHLQLLAKAYGFQIPSAATFLDAGKYLMFTQDYAYAAKFCSIEDADDPAYGYFLRGMGWVKHMATHASSVIADFERCIRINPEYEPRLRHYLQMARTRVAGKNPAIRANLTD